MKRHHMGSTLLELLIILVIVGLIVQFAIPHYGMFIEKGRAHERLADLLSLQTELEACYLEAHDYELCAEGLGARPPNILELDAARFSYTLSLHAPSPGVPSYRIETNSAHEISIHEH